MPPNPKALAGPAASGKLGNHRKLYHKPLKSQENSENAVVPLALKRQALSGAYKISENAMNKARINMPIQTLNVKIPDCSRLPSWPNKTSN